MALAIVACAIVTTPCYGKTEKANAKAMDSLSYCIGANMGFGLKQQLGPIPFSLDEVKRGVDKGYAQKSKQTHDEAVEVLRAYFSEKYSERGEAYKEALKSNPNAVFNAFSSKKECKSISYAFGNDLGNNLRQAKFSIQLGWLWKGFVEGWNDKTVISQDQIIHYISHYFMTVVPAQNEARSKAWLEAKKQEEGVKSTESGLVYKVLVAGDMSKAAKNDEDIVKVHYIGRLQDGTVFDASRFENRSKQQQAMMRKSQPNNFDEKGKPLQADEPIEFPLDRVIKGWAEGVKLIGPGGKIMLYIPAKLAYGDRGVGNDIGPNEALEFEVELLDVKSAQ